MNFPHARGLSISGMLLVSLSSTTLAMPVGSIRLAMGLHLQQSGAGAPLGKLLVAPDIMAGLCTTMVSPAYPHNDDHPAMPYTVVVQAVIWRSGKVTPMRVVSGENWLQSEAMNTVRLWRFKPFARGGDFIDVTTELRVNFDPNKPGGMISHPGR